MKSFLCKDKRPIIKWSKLPNDVFFQGDIPSGYSLGICPGDGYVVVDIDRHGSKNGFEHLPRHIYLELMETLNYATKNKGRHCWFKYTGIINLGNKTSKYGIDLRVENKGYVIWYHTKPIQECITEIKESSDEMNIWLEQLFYAKTLNK